MANSKVKPAFNQQVVVLPIETIVPQKELSPEFRKSTTYKRISASLEHVGLIEPLVVYPRGPRDYLLLDGHARLDILKPVSYTHLNLKFRWCGKSMIGSRKGLQQRGKSLRGLMDAAW